MTKYINIAGNEMPVKYGFAALMEFTDIAGLSMNELESLGDTMNLKTAITLIWCGFKHGARAEKKSFEMSIEDVADLLDEDMEAMEKVLSVFGDSFAKEEKK